MKQGVLACALAMTVSTAAHATLTDSENAQIRTFVIQGVAERASRVRSLVARPDLTPKEVAAPLIAGFRKATFDEKHQRFQAVGTRTNPTHPATPSDE